MNYLTILDNRGGFWTDTKEEAWEMVIGGADHKAQIIDIAAARFANITIGGGSESYILTPVEVAALKARRLDQMKAAA